MNRDHRSAFTLVELLVVIAIIGVMIATLLPAIQASRETARRAECISQLRQLILAVEDYELAHEQFPAGTVNPQGPIQNLPNGHHISWIARILPYLDERTRYGQLDLDVSAYHVRNDPVRQSTIELLACPSDPSSAWPLSSYAGCHNDVEAPIDVDNHGVLFLNSQVTRDDLVDGAAYTIFIGEKFSDSTDLGWLSGTPATLRNTGSPLGTRPDDSQWLSDLPWFRRPSFDDGRPWETAEAAGDEFRAEGDADANQPSELAVAAEQANPAGEPDQDGLLPHSRLGGNPAAPLAVGGFWSAHPAGVNFAFGDGSIRFIANRATPSLMQRLANRSDGQIVDASEW